MSKKERKGWLAGTYKEKMVGYVSFEQIQNNSYVSAWPT
jgi:hypothetical protein